MRAVITITGRHYTTGYHVSYRTATGAAFTNRSAGNTPEEAAAEAVNQALRHGSRGFDILAPREVLACIPPHFLKGK